MIGEIALIAFAKGVVIALWGVIADRLEARRLRRQQPPTP